jgi:hypothetical protein
MRGTAIGTLFAPHMGSYGTFGDYAGSHSRASGSNCK